MSVAIDDVNRRQSHFESILKAGGRIAGPKVECGELNAKSIVANKMSKPGEPARQTYLAIVRDVCCEVNRSIQTGSVGFI